MAYKIILVNEVYIDIVDAREFYNKQLPGLGKRFKNDMSAVIEKIKENPYIYGFRFSGFRTANFQIFPYQIHFTIKENDKLVIIFAILHGYRNPDYIAKRVW